MRVLIALDRTEYAEIVAEHGFDQAVRRGADEIHVVTAVSHPGELEPTLNWLGDLTEDLAETFHWHGRALHRHVLRGDPFEVISQTASELAPDLVVVGRFSSPSLATRLLDAIRAPVLVINIEGHDLEPQCPSCVFQRQLSGGERLFCAAHTSDRIPNLVSRLPPSYSTGSRMW